LVDPPRRWWTPALRFAPSLVLVLMLAAGQKVLAPLFPALRTERNDAFGISVPVPKAWLHGANRLGQLAFRNGLPGLGRATFAAEAVYHDGAVDAGEEARKFADEALQPSTIGPDVLKVSPGVVERASVAGRPAWRVKATLDETFGRSELVAYFVARGELVYQLVFTYPVGFPGYAQVHEQMVAGIRFEEPKTLREARARALLFPNAPWGLGLLGEALRKQGEPVAAAEALRSAVREVPASSDLRVQLALSLLQAGMVDEACDAAQAAVLYAPKQPAPLEVAARCEFERGNPGRALERLKEARAQAPNDERLRQTEAKLRAALEQRAQ
jgi:tetratricopeptide (TPR) repeat protein